MPVMRNTVQKEIIHRTLCTMGNHPTALMVYEEVHHEHPSISRSTVYRILGKLADEGVILRLHLAGSDDRYDGRIDRHSHVRCRMCGAIADIPAVVLADPADTAGFLLEDWSVEYTGLCPACRKAVRAAQKKGKPLESDLS